ncbi:hypothetical protein [Novosphingobium sp. 9U]|uniref:hypothetical protein n=1 Tax=Novosphingobium sp. 9U TaxID=2653158 RepID=UPI0012F457B9|nr:hypothetical protein [Novosphingobium sp. 9U]VWX54605.1 conserved hypothetical protein [Novosphingobium sp. 9U]
MPQNIAAADLFGKSWQVPKDLFYLAAAPSGTMFCDKAQKRRQTAAFDRRFGKRFNKLVSVVRMRDGLGWSAEDVMVTPCYVPTPQRAAQLLDEFEGQLRAFEERFGLPHNVP